MQAAAPRARKPVVEELAAAEAAQVVAAAPAACPLSPAEQEFAHAPQAYREARRIPAFLACAEPDGVVVGLANDKFREVAGWDESKEGRSVEAIAFLRASGIGAAVAAFLRGDEQVREFESNDGHLVGGRHFEVKMGRL